MIKPDARDWHFYGGLLLIAVGFAFVYWPLALIVPGLAGFYWGGWRLR